MNWKWIIFFISICHTGVIAGEADENVFKSFDRQIRSGVEQMEKVGVGFQDAVTFTRRLKDNRFTPADIAKSQEIVITARKSGLPAKPLMDKAYEGISKNVPAGKIIHAMERVRTRYAFAHLQVRNLFGTETGGERTREIIADGLAAGLKPDDVKDIATRIRDRSKETTQDTEGMSEQTFKAVREMTRLGVQSESARRVVNQALRQKYSAGDMDAMRRAFIRHSKTIAPSALAERFHDAINHGMSAGRLGHAGMAGSGHKEGMGMHGGGHGGQSGGGHGGGGHGGGGHGGMH